MMNSVKKYTTFDELKSPENKQIQNASSLTKHNNFKEAIMEIRLQKVTKVEATKHNR